MIDFHWLLGDKFAKLSVNGKKFGAVTRRKDGTFLARCGEVSQTFADSGEATEWLSARARIGHQGVLRAGLWRPEAATDTPSQPDPEAPDIQGRLGPRVGGGYSGGPNMGER